MIYRLLVGAAALALAPAAALGAVVQFAAPAGNLPVEHLANSAFAAILPSGRIVTPAGTSVEVAENATGLALSPDGRYAVVGSAPASAPAAALSVIDTQTMTVSGQLPAAGPTAFGGVAVVRDPRRGDRNLIFAVTRAGDALDVFDLDPQGRVVPDATPAIPLAAPAASGAVLGGAELPALTVAPDGRHVYVAGITGSGVAVVDTAARAVRGSLAAAGFAPSTAVATANQLLITNEGLMAYAPVGAAQLAPPFATPPAQPQAASSLDVFDLTAAGELAPSVTSGAVPMDETPDGHWIVGGAHPTALVVTPDGANAFVAMTGVDRIATVALRAPPHVAGGTELRLFDRGPYGTQPVALALSTDGTRLYVALAGLNAIAVLDARDPLHVHRLGLIPTGWQPAALALSPDDRTLYVLNAAGAGRSGPAASAPIASTLEKIDLGTVMLRESTRITLNNTRSVRTRTPHYPAALRDVVVIVEGSTTFDALLGDLGYGPADPGDVQFGALLTPNLHALARRYGIAGNVFTEDERSCVTHQWLDGGIATPDAQRSFAVGTCAAERPDLYPRAGYIFNNLARHHVTFRDYGDLVRLAGYDDGSAADPLVDDPLYAGIADLGAPTQGLGGRYGADTPAPAVLAAHIDPNYPGWNARIRDQRRAREFVRDFGLLVRTHAEPRFTQIWLPSQAAPGPGILAPAEQVADSDRALGTIVEYLTHLPSWRQTAIFIVSDRAGDAPDHVDRDRTYALVVSPFAKRHYVGMRHLSTVSVLKTVEGILKLPPLALGDLLATDMSDFFKTTPTVAPFGAIPVPPQAANGSGALRELTGTASSTPNATRNLLDRTVTTNGLRGAKGF